MEVHSKLGPGFLEKVNENALILLFKKNGIKTKTQVPIKVTFEEEVIGNYIADILADGKIILELKSAESIGNSHKAQALNYLKVTGLRLAIILNFGKDKLEYYRVVN